MSMLLTIRARRLLGVTLIAAAAGGCAGAEPTARAAAYSEAAVEQASAPASLPKVSALPAGYQSVGELAGRGVFYTQGEPTARIDDGSHYHGYDGPGVWAREPKGTRTQGLLYRVEDGAIVSAGYLIRQADLVAGKSFHGLTLRELDLPPARSMTVDLITGNGPRENQYLMLWHFRPSTHPAKPMLPAGELPAITSLPDGFVVYACDDYPERFCPGMGRHYTDPSSLGRDPDAVGNEGVIYGEAAGKLIFIEYVLGQQELRNGVSWPAMPLDDVPIPSIDNVHILHFGSPESVKGRYTVHMYFLPEDIYLGWKTEPDTL